MSKSGRPTRRYLHHTPGRNRHRMMRWAIRLTASSSWASSAITERTPSTLSSEVPVITRTLCFARFHRSCGNRSSAWGGPAVSAWPQPKPG